MAGKKQVGKVKFYNIGKGFGFIEGAGSDGKDLFFPFRAFADEVTVADIRGLRGKKVEYATEPGTGKDEGKTLVKNLRPVAK
jgi:cold shock CspA family protein